MNRLIAAAVLLAALGWPARAAAADRTGSAAVAAQARRELDELDAKIAALQSRARREGAEARARVERRVAALRADEADADRALSKLESSGASARKDLKAVFDRALKKLRAAYRRAEKEAPWNRASKPS